MRKLISTSQLLLTHYPLNRSTLTCQFSLSESNLNWQSLFTELFTALHLGLCLIYVADVTSRRRLRSSTSSELVIPLSRLVTVGDRSFAAAAWFQALEHAARGHYICAVSTAVSTKTEGAFVSAILSGHYTVARLACCALWSLKFLLRPP